MEGLFPLNLDNWLVYLLIWARLMGIVYLFPYFSYQGIPFTLRLYLSLVIALLIFLSMETRPELELRVPFEMVLLLGKEVLIGLALGYLVVLMFSVFLNAGQMVDMKAGLMLSGVFEPQYGSQITFMGQFYYLLALVFFLTLNGHHYFLHAMAESYVMIPLDAAFMGTHTALGVGRLFANMFYLSFQMVAPIIVILMLMDIALGLIAKTVPQVHVFILGLPLKIAMSMLLFAILLPVFGSIWDGYLDQFVRHIFEFMQGW